MRELFYVLAILKGLNVRAFPGFILAILKGLNVRAFLCFGYLQGLKRSSLFYVL